MPLNFTAFCQQRTLFKFPHVRPGPESFMVPVDEPCMFQAKPKPSGHSSTALFNMDRSLS